LRNTCNSVARLSSSALAHLRRESHFYLALQTFACEMHLKFSTYLPRALHLRPAFNFQPCARVSGSWSVVCSIAVVVVVIITLLLSSCIKCRCHSLARTEPAISLPPVINEPTLFLSYFQFSQNLCFFFSFIFIYFFTEALRLKNFAHNNKMDVGCFRVTRALAYAIENVTQ